jgi:hypothetical protein
MAKERGRRLRFCLLTRSWLSALGGGSSRPSTSCVWCVRQTRVRNQVTSVRCCAERGCTPRLSRWRAQRDNGALKALSQPRGRRAADSRDAQIVKLRQRAERAEAELSTARKVIEVQGNVSALLEELLEPRGATPDKSTER